MRMETAGKIIKTNEFVLFFLIFSIIIFFGLLNPRFLVLENIVQYLNSGVVLGFLTFGLAATIISGNFDFSIGAMCGFGTVIISQLMVTGLPFAAALLLSMLIMILFGALNGFLVGTLGIPGLLVTLGTSSLYYGIALVMTGGQAISVMNMADYAMLEFFGKSDLGTLPFGMVLLAIVFVISLLLLNYSSWGRRLILIGSSGEAARFAGINHYRPAF